MGGQVAGTVLGFFVGMAYIGWALESETSKPLDLYVALPIAFGFFWLAGFLFTRTLGITAMLGMFGAAIATIVSLATGAFAFAPAFLLHTIMLLVVQHGLKSRLNAYAEMSSRRRLAS